MCNRTGSYFEPIRLVLHLRKKKGRLKFEGKLFARRRTSMTKRSPTHQEIAARAYQLYLERGRQHGHEVDDWLQAEYELMELPIRKLAEMELPAPVKAARPAFRKRSLVEVVQTAMML
jgi:hypothetical protein